MNLFVEELKEISEADLLTLESLMNQLTGRTVKLSRDRWDKSREFACKALCNPQGRSYHRNLLTSCYIDSYWQKRLD